MCSMVAPCFLLSSMQHMKDGWEDVHEPVTHKDINIVMVDGVPAEAMTKDGSAVEDCHDVWELPIDHKTTYFMRPVPQPEFEDLMAVLSMCPCPCLCLGGSEGKVSMVMNNSNHCVRSYVVHVWTCMPSTPHVIVAPATRIPTIV